MSTANRLTVAAALSVLLASSALLPVFAGLGWLPRVAAAVVVVAAASAGARSLRAPAVLQSLAGLVALGAYAALVSASGTLALGLLPTGGTLTQLAATFREGLRDVEQLAPPVPSNPGLVLLAVLGVGGIAVVVDALAVTARRTALAGLPLLLLFAVPSAVLADGLGVLPFVVGAAGWLGLLLADSNDRVRGWGDPVRSDRSTVAGAPDPSLGRVGRRIGAAALGVAVVVPAVLPGLDAQLFSGGGPGFGGGSRSVTTYNPITRLSGQLELPEPVELLRYETTDATPDYLRLTTLDRFDEDSGWSSSELSGDPDEDRVQDGVPTPQGQTLTSSGTNETTIEMIGNLDGPWLPMPFPSRNVDVSGPWLWDAEAETAFTTRTSLAELDEPYVVTSTQLEPSVDLLRRGGSAPSDLEETYADAPELTGYVRREVELATAGAQTDYDRVAALQAYFQDGARFEYSYEAPRVDGVDGLEAFLQGGQGFCEQYASAMAAMVRSLGIPARVAVGFTPGELQATGERLVTTQEAHAWPEVWFDGAGWVRFEPTPRTGFVSAPDYSEAPADAPVDPLASAAPSTAPSTAPVLPGDPGAVDRGADGASDAAGSSSDGAGPSPWLLLVPAVAVVLTIPWLATRLRARRRWRRPSPSVAWAAVTDDAVDVGHRWRPADSPRAAAAHLLSGRTLPERSTAALQRLASAAERSRYARSSDEPAVGATLRRDVAAVRSGLLDSVDRRTRWTARLAPPSTLTWAGSAVGTALADLLDRFDVLVSAAGARARHPRRRRPA